MRRKVCLGLFTYCSPASWPQSQSEVSVESAGALGEEGGRQTLKAQQRRRRQEGREKEETEPISDQEHTADGVIENTVLRRTECKKTSVCASYTNTNESSCRLEKC